MAVFMARQPIFNRKQDVFAYELLFRSSLANFFSHPDKDQAATSVMADSFLLFGMETLTGRHKAFLNFTRQALVNGYATLLPKEMTVIEVLEDVTPDEEVIEACRKIKKAGYLLALDDFVYQENYEPLIELADFIKVDFLETTPDERRITAEKLTKRGKLLLAEKVETQDEFQMALKWGYHYFQGFFFSKPVVLTNKMDSGHRAHYVEILRRIHQPGLDLREIGNIIQRDVTLSYKLIQYINSAFFALRTEVRSIHHAVVLLGERELKKWASLLALTTLGESKPKELMSNAIIRARFCEELAKYSGLEHKGQDCFMMGMFSLIDAILDRPLAFALKNMPLAKDIKGALMRVARNKFRSILEIMLSYEQADWKGVGEWSTRLGVKESEIPNIYMKAIEWAQSGIQDTRDD